VYTCPLVPRMAGGSAKICVLFNSFENGFILAENSKKLKGLKEMITVSVKDHGSGITPENLKTIFDKFSTAPSDSDNQTEGTGLGLAICKAIIEAHDGRI